MVEINYSKIRKFSIDQIYFILYFLDFLKSKNFIIKLNFPSLAIRKCWASTVESIRDTDNDKNDDDSGMLEGAPISDFLLFYDDFCPLFSWVAAGGAATDGSYGNVATADAGNTNPLGDKNLAVSLRQFAFNDDAAGQSAGFFYHCEVNTVFVLS